ncbi:class I SAM-dependent methyltransferase [Phyllobacteriaceae bacterium JZ32]
MSEKICNCCGNNQWGNIGERRDVRCLSCGSLERTRVLKLLLDRYGYPRKNIKILHFAPEKAIYDILSNSDFAEYDAYDLFPENFKFGSIRRFDLCSEASKLESNYYDLIIHSHVMEHIPCNYTAVLYHIHRSLKENGVHFMCIPFMGGFFEEDFSPLEPTEAVSRFGQNDHVRRFGKKDFHRSIGMIFNISGDYHLENFFSREDLDRYNIPEAQRSGFTGTSVFPLRKRDLLLV